MRRIIVGITVLIILLSITGCSAQNEIENKSKLQNSETNTVLKKEVKILEVKTDLTQQDKKGANGVNFLQEEVKSGVDNGSKKAFNINLKEGQSLRVDTATEYPITVMLKDNSTEEYVYNNTQIPKDSSILLGRVEKDGNYELMLDFNEIEVFNYDVFIINK